MNDSHALIFWLVILLVGSVAVRLYGVDWRKKDVYAASAEALAAGVQVGMTLRSARAQCTGAQLLPARPAYYAQTFAPVASLLSDFGERVEAEESFQNATCYLDLSEVSRQHAAEIATEMGKGVRTESRLSPTVGVARGKFPARVAAMLVSPNTAHVIAPGREAAMLAPLPIETLPLDTEMARRLRLLGIHTVGQFAALPRAAVVAQFGKSGQHLHRLACGDDPRPVQRRLSRPAEERTHYFEDPVGNYTVLNNVIRHLAQQLATSLADRFVAAKTLWLMLGLEDQARKERRRILREPLVNADALGRALMELLKQMGLSCGVTTLHALVTDFVPLASTSQQLALFPTPTHQTPPLKATLPDLVARFGGDRFLALRPADPQAALWEQRFSWHPASEG
jgi:nucleotidyltransferase/DNA polymerase involved in DNA repair